MMKIRFLLLMPLILIMFLFIFKVNNPKTAYGVSSCSGNSCTDCILNKTTDPKDVLIFYRDNGWNTGCSHHNDIVADFCTKANPSGCASTKNGVCASACANGGTSTPIGPKGIISCKNNPTCTVTDFNKDPIHPGMGAVTLDLTWQDWMACEDSNVVPPGEKPFSPGRPSCYWVATELCETTDDKNEPPTGNPLPLVASLDTKQGDDNGIIPYNGVATIGPIWWIKPGYTYTYKLYETGYTCTGRPDATNCKTNGEDPRRHCKGKEVASKTITTAAQSPSPSTPSANNVTCSISGPASAARNSKATFTATSSDTRIRTMEIYYNFNDRSVGGDYKKVMTCDTDVTGLSGGCKGEVDTSTIPADKTGFVALCNAYDWKPREDGKDNCNPGNNDPIHCQPDGKEKVNSCTGNPLWSTGRDFGWAGCGSSSHKEINLTAAAATTTSYRIAENLADLAAADWQDYTADGMTISRAFTDKNPGTKTLFVEFKDSTGKKGGCGVNNSQPCQVQIRVLSGNPVVTSCVLGFEGNNAIVNLKGSNFGSDKGKVKSNDKDFAVREWKNDSVKVIWQNAPVGENLPIVLTNADGQIAESQCNSISQLSLGAKVFCRAPSQNNTDNVDLILAGDYAGGTKVKQKVTVDKDGVVQGLSQRLETGKNYFISLKMPKSLRKTAPVTVDDGTNIIPNFVLPVGDIFPADNGDGVINALDKAELNRQWNISGDTTGRSADLNKDGRVNSIDWACMRYDFGKSDDKEPANPPVASTTTTTTTTSTGVGTTAPAGVGATASQ